MEKSTIGKIYIAFVIILAILLLTLSYMDNEYKENLNEKYDVDTENGEELIVCGDGSYDVYKPNDKTQTTLCGKFIN